MKEILLKVGDTIKCADADEMVEISGKLALDGIETDFVYKRNGEEGLWLVVTAIHEEEERR